MSATWLVVNVNIDKLVVHIMNVSTTRPWIIVCETIMRDTIIHKSVSQFGSVGNRSSHGLYVYVCLHVICSHLIEVRHRATTEKENISGVYKKLDRRMTTNITTTDLIPNRTNMGRNNTMFGIVLLAFVITIMLQWVWLIEITSFSLSNRPAESADSSTCAVSMVS